MDVNLRVVDQLCSDWNLGVKIVKTLAYMSHVI